MSQVGMNIRGNTGKETTVMLDGIQLNGGLREFKRCFCFIAIAKEARVYNMFDVIHLHEATVARRESRIFTDGITKDNDCPLPAFRLEFHQKILAAKPTVVVMNTKENS